MEVSEPHSKFPLFSAALSMTGERREIPLKNIDLKVEVRDIFAILTLEQTYLNSEDQAVEVEYLFPIMAHSCILDFQAEIGKQVYDGKVYLKEKVDELRKKLHQENKPTVTAHQQTDFQEVVRLNIGILQPKEELIIRIKMSAKFDLFSGNLHRLFVPLVFGDRNSFNIVSDQKDEPNSPQSSPSNEHLLCLDPNPPYSFSFTLMFNKFSTDEEGPLHYISGFSPQGDFSTTIGKDTVIYFLNDQRKRYPNTDIIVHMRRRVSTVYIERKSSWKDQSPLTLNQVRFSPDRYMKMPLKFPTCAFANIVVQPEGRPNVIRRREQDKGYSLHHRGRENY